MTTLACEGGPAPFSEPEEARFEAALATMHASQEAQGSVIAIDQRGRRYQGAMGMADVAAGRAMTVTTPFRSASIGKTFIGALILSLHEAGWLSVDDRLSDHMPDVPGGEGITLRMLLTHTSGIANYTHVAAYREAKAADPAHVFTYAELVAMCTAVAPDFPPGTAWNYSNTGYIVLGMIAEQLTGRPLFEELTRRFFGPLGMSSTRPVSQADPEPDLALGYETVGDEVRPVSEAGLYSAYVADGGAFITTLDDLIVWARAFLGGRLHSAQTLAVARQPEGGDLLNGIAQAFDLEGGGYALGFIAAEDALAGPLYAGAGNGDGVRTFVGYFPEHDLAFATFVGVGDGDVPIVQTLDSTRPILVALREHLRQP